MLGLKRGGRISIFIVGFILSVFWLPSVWASGSPWATGQVRIEYTSLIVSPENQSVCLNVCAGVRAGSSIGLMQRENAAMLLLGRTV